MRDELMREIIMILQAAGMDSDEVKSNLVILLNKYDVTTRCTEVAVVNEDDITKYIRLFLINKRVAGRTERTIRHYTDTLRRFFGEVQKSPIDVTSDDIKLYLATIDVRDHASKVYQKNISRVIGSFYTWMQREEYITRNPMNKVDEIKIPKKKKEAFTETDVERIRMAASDDDRMACMVEVLLSTWCRVSELCMIKITEISEDGEKILIHGKGSKDRTCYLNARAKLKLEKYLSERKDNNEYLFPACKIRVNNPETCFSKECKKEKVKMKDWWKAPNLVTENKHTDARTVESNIRKLGKKTGVENTHPHRFRRTGATFALRRGMPIEQVSKLLGHESIETTQIYLDISEQEIEQAHRKYV